MPISTGMAARATSTLIARITRATSRWSGVCPSRNARAAVVSWLANDSAPTRVATYVPRAADAEAAREHLVARLLGDPVRLAGQQRLVDFDSTVDDTPVEHQLVAAPDDQQVAQHDLALVGDPLLAVAQDRRRRSREDAQPVEGLLGAHLLVDPDDDVDDDQHDGHRRVAVQSEQRQHDRDADEQQVDGVERVVAQDVDVGPARADPRVVAHARGARRAASSSLRPVGGVGGRSASRGSSRISSESADVPWPWRRSRLPCAAMVAHRARWGGRGSRRVAARDASYSAPACIASARRAPGSAVVDDVIGHRPEQEATGTVEPARADDDHVRLLSLGGGDDA